MSNNLIVRIAEGLGNQMFMYAHAYALSKKIRYNLLVDNESAYFKKKHIRNYQLDNFNITSKNADNHYKFNSYTSDIKRKVLIKTDFFRNKKRFLIEKRDRNKLTHFYNYDLNNFSKSFYVEGHYESEKYFINYKTQLINEFKIKNNNKYVNNKFVDLIKKNKDSVVSICIRQHNYSERTGNMYNPVAIKKSQKYVADTIAYVYRAINFIATKIKDPIYLIWSNDFNNLREYFPENKFIFIDNNQNKVLTDFYLFSLCNNFIVGPTSFHWWGAWLNTVPGKICIRPKDDLSPSNNKDFWPKDWLVV